MGLQPGTVEGERITLSDGRSLDLWFVRPAEGTSGPHPVVLAFPWGAGTADLAFGMVRTYWDRVVPERGYVVVAPAALGSNLMSDTVLVNEVLDWAATEFTIDSTRIAMVGASNGGRGVFHAQEVSAIRPAALIAMPGAIVPSTDLSPLNGRPVRLMVGETDTPWVNAAEEAETQLQAAGAEVELFIVPGQGHVLAWPQEELADWLDSALGR